MINLERTWNKPVPCMTEGLHLTKRLQLIGHTRGAAKENREGDNKKTTVGEKLICCNKSPVGFQNA